MLYAVIPAGGSGTRLWPLSRTGNPKFLHPLTGSALTLLQATVERLAPLAPPDQTYVSTGVGHAGAVARQLPELPADNVLVEPSPRDSCAAIGLAAAVIALRDPQAVMGAFPADHLVGRPERFAEVVRQAVDGARRGYLMTVGIPPTPAQTGYGYLECGDPVDGGPVRRVRQVTQEPTHEGARGYVPSGPDPWDARMFVLPGGTVPRELGPEPPGMHARPN